MGDSYMGDATGEPVLNYLFNSKASEDQTLCEECSQLDLDAVFDIPTTAVEDEKGIAVAELGCRLNTVGKKSPCSLCSLLLSVRIPSKTVLECHLRAFSALRSCGEVALAQWGGSADMSLDSIFLAVLPVPSKAYEAKPTMTMSDGSVLAYSDEMEELARHCPETGFISRVTVAPGRFCGRLVGERVDYQLCREWLDFCRSHHHMACGLKGSFVLKSFKVIDCDTLTITPASLDWSYVALSYVWSSAKPQDGPLSSADSQVASKEASSKGFLLNVVPKVIKDAIKATKALGSQFLWVDKYCIDQEDPEEKHEQIQKMNLIYERADFTIIASADQGHDYGLPGVDENAPRTPQPAVRIWGTTFVSTLNHPAYTILNSKWSTRGWTYQEAVLSRRRLVFTSQQVYFECNAMYVAEALHKPLPQLHTQSMEHFLPSTRMGLFNGVGGGPPAIHNSRLQYHYNGSLARFWGHVENYTSRNLTFASDALNAFHGILETFAADSQPLFHIWGLPVEPKKGSGVTRSLAFALTWTHKRDYGLGNVQRRWDFPSWSWAGWEGTVAASEMALYRDDTNLQWCISIDLECWLERKDGTTVPLQEVELAEQRQFLPCLHIETWITPLHLWILVEDPQLNPPSTGEPQDSAHLSFLLKPSPTSPRSWKCSSSLLTPIQSPADLLARLRECRWSCILAADTIWGARFVLVEWCGDGVARRVGMVSLVSEGKNEPELLRRKEFKCLFVERRKFRLE